MVFNLAEQGIVTGEVQSEALLNNTQLNLHRMKRIDKRAELNEELIATLKKIEFPVDWFVLTEGWCGDASQILPYLNKMAKANSNINLKLILRDDHPEIMNAYLTNGGKAIPKLIIVDPETGEELGNWGPRPENIQNEVSKLKAADPENFKANLGKMLHTWYGKDKGQSVQAEMQKLINNQLLALESF
jgi:hypothetical protein